MRVIGIPTRGHLAAIARVGLGMSLLLRPEPIVRVAGGGDVSSTWLVAARILGARHLLEGVIVNVPARPELVWLGAGVDAIHAATAGASAFAGEENRRLLAVNAGVALGFSFAGAHHARALAGGG
jgi:hypothetical protein